MWSPNLYFVNPTSARLDYLLKDPETNQGTLGSLIQAASTYFLSRHRLSLYQKGFQTFSAGKNRRRGPSNPRSNDDNIPIFLYGLRDFYRCINEMGVSNERSLIKVISQTEKGTKYSKDSTK